MVLRDLHGLIGSAGRDGNSGFYFIGDLGFFQAQGMFQGITDFAGGHQKQSRQQSGKQDAHIKCGFVDSLHIPKNVLIGQKRCN
tara:strand:- start:8033 stop:8284 length:252 start_codon:yes stop_codon:yes gene_type:complete